MERLQPVQMALRLLQRWHHQLAAHCNTSAVHSQGSANQHPYSVRFPSPNTVSESLSAATSATFNVGAVLT